LQKIAGSLRAYCFEKIVICQLATCLP